MKLNHALVKRALRDDSWSLGNQVLYDLCAQYPRHDSDSEIVAKVWLIGRAYSAAVERGRRSVAHGPASNEEFYVRALPKAMRASGLDVALRSISKLKTINALTAPPVLDAHAQLVRLFRTLTGKDKRSLASKYLHFHHPRLFFIYDSRAGQAIRALGLPPVDIKVPRGADRAYAQFVGAALGVRSHVASRFGALLTPRQLDRLLLGQPGRDA